MTRELPLSVKPFHSATLAGFETKEGEAVGGTFEEHPWTAEQFREYVEIYIPGYVERYAKAYYYRRVWGWAFAIRERAVSLIPPFVLDRLPYKVRNRIVYRKQIPSTAMARHGFVTVKDNRSVSTECNGQPFVKIGTSCPDLRIGEGAGRFEFSNVFSCVIQDNTLIGDPE